MDYFIWSVYQKGNIVWIKYWLNTMEYDEFQIEELNSFLENLKDFPELKKIIIETQYNDREKIYSNKSKIWRYLDQQFKLIAAFDIPTKFKGL